MEKDQGEPTFSNSTEKEQKQERVWDHVSGSRTQDQDPLPPSSSSAHRSHVSSGTSKPLQGPSHPFGVHGTSSKPSSSSVQDSKGQRSVSTIHLLPSTSAHLNLRVQPDKSKGGDERENGGVYKGHGFELDTPSSKGFTEPLSGEYDLEDCGFEKADGRGKIPTENSLVVCSRRTVLVLLSVACMLLVSVSAVLTVYLIRKEDVDQAPSFTGRTAPYPTDTPVNPSGSAAAPPTTGTDETLAESQPSVSPSRRSNPTEPPTSSSTKTSTSKPTVSTVVQEDPYQDVIIIGAGWAGLGAMDVLARNGTISARILEARDYIGGRSHTIRDFVPGLPTELGSAWIYEDTGIKERETELGLKYAVTDTGFDYFGMYETSNLRGQPGLSKLSDSQKQALFREVWSGENGFVPFATKEINDLWDTGGEDVDIEQVVDQFLDEEGSDLTQEDQQFLNAMTHNEIGSEFGAPLNDLSALETTYTLEEPGGTGMHYLAVPGGGYDSLINDLSETFVDRIQLNSRVTTVQYGEEGEMARVTYIDESGNTRIATASAVLVTVSLGVLKASDVEFVPGLPQEKMDAINGLGYGNLNKCILYWEDTDQAATWWPSEQVWLGLVTEEDETSGVWTLFLNDMAQGNGGYPILVGLIAGDDADAMESQTDEQVLDAVLVNLRTMLGGTVPKPTKYMVTRWRQDEFSRGAYSFPYAGSDDWSLRSDLRRPVGNLFFAGEATNEDWFSTTEGAFNSGVEAGEEIAESLR